MPSSEALNRETTEGAVYYTDNKVSFIIRYRQVMEVCITDPVPSVNDSPEWQTAGRT